MLTMRAFFNHMISGSCFRAIGSGALILVLSLSYFTAAQASEQKEIPTKDMTELSLEALMDIQVTSVSRKAQKLSQAAAAAFVITHEDIRRSGATCIPELLRMVPGVQVARIDANKWAVSIRGFNGRFSNKLLVLKDGRSIYTPLFSGVYWEQQETLLDDIERIEVIRGPGAALWGANAVNGVINIISKKAGESEGGTVAGGGGTTERGFGSVRYGLSFGPDSDMRLYATFANRGPGSNTTGGETHDAWQSAATGFRIDNHISGSDSLTLQGDFFGASMDETYTLYQLPAVDDPRYSFTRDSTSRASGGNLLGRWQRDLSGTDSLALQLYYDHYRRTMTVLDDTRDTIDLDFQHRIAVGERHDVVWGGGYRFVHDHLSNTPYIFFPDTDTGKSLVSGFIRDEISLLPEWLSLILGARLEHNDYSGFEIQPNARLLWTPSPQHTFWVSVSRAVRTPSRGDQGIRYRFRTMSPTETGLPQPVRLEIDGTSNFASETVIAYEVGYRTEPWASFSLDTSLFYNYYDKLRVRQEGITEMTSTGPLIHYPLANDMHGDTCGVEVSASLHPVNWWRIQASYTLFSAIMRLENGSSDTINLKNATSGSPRHQGSLRSGFDMTEQISLDLWLLAVDRVESIDSSSIPGYLTMDARLAWAPQKTLELAIVGRNLLQRSHPEYIPEFINTTPSEVPRSVYGAFTWKF